MHTAHLTAFDKRDRRLVMTWEFREFWRFIGFHLGIDMDSLDATDAESTSIGDCLRYVLTDHWIQNKEAKPTLDEVKMALQYVLSKIPPGNCYHIKHCIVNILSRLTIIKVHGDRE